MTLIRVMTGEAWNTLMAEFNRGMYNVSSELELFCVDEMPVTAENYEILKERGFIDDPVECGNNG